MFTCCPECQTCFRVTPDQLAVAKGLVRCGNCSNVFNGREHIKDELSEKQDGAARQKPEADVVEESPPPAPETPIAEDAPAAFADESAFTAHTAEDDIEHIDLDAFAANWQEEPPEEKSVEASPFEETTPSDEVLEPASEAQPEPSETPLENPFHEDPLKASFDPFEHMSIERSEATTEDEEEHDEVFSSIEEDEEDAAPTYSYKDINDHLQPEKDISEIFADMNQQLSLAIDEDKTPRPKSAAEARVKEEETEINQAIDQIFAEAEQNVPLEGDLENAYSVEKEVLASLGKSAYSTSADSEDIAYEDEAITLSGGLDDKVISSSQLNRGRQKTRTEDVPLRLRESLAVAEPEKRSLWKSLAMLLFIVILSAGLAGQAALFRNIELVSRYPQLKPAVALFCQYAPCRIRVKRDIDNIQLLSRDIRVHPKEKNALLITATLVNNAAFPQPYPDILVTLSDLTGSTVAQRRFTPANYMGELNSPFLLMNPGTPAHIGIGVADPGKDAINFEFSFM